MNSNVATAKYLVLPCKLCNALMFQGNLFVFFMSQFIYLAFQVFKVIYGLIPTLGINETLYAFPLFYVVEIVCTCHFDISGGR
jgi:hypothetical protein